ncbi:MAG: hypothetical protein HC932_05580 [Thermales bacterium]|nr:hypothetical protein [Thermales bacterium]
MPKTSHAGGGPGIGLSSTPIQVDPAQSNTAPIGPTQTSNQIIPSTTSSQSIQPLAMGLLMVINSSLEQQPQVLSQLLGIL